MTKRTKGIITLGTVLACGIFIIGGVTVFWQTARSTDNKISEVKTEVSSELSLTNQRVSVVETQVKSILTGQEKMEQRFDDLFNSLIK